MATQRALIEPEQRRFKTNPYNKKHGLASGKLVSHATECAVKIGSTKFVTSPTKSLLIVDGNTLIGLSLSEENYVQISVSLYNEKNELLAYIVDNEWISGEADIWDLESKHHELKIRSGKYKIKLELNTEPDPIQLKADLWFNGVRFRLQPSKIECDGIQASLRLQNVTSVGHCLIASSVTRTFELRVPDVVSDPLELCNSKLDLASSRRRGELGGTELIGLNLVGRRAFEMGEVGLRLKGVNIFSPEAYQQILEDERPSGATIIMINDDMPIFSDFSKDPKREGEA